MRPAVSLGFDLCCSPVPVADLGPQPLGDRVGDFGDAGGGDGVDFVEVRPGQVFDGPGPGGVLGAAVGPVEVEAPIEQSLLIVGDGSVVEVGLAAGVCGVAVAVDLHVVEPPRHHLAVPVHMAPVGDGVIEVHEQPRTRRRVRGIDQHRAALQSVAVICEHFGDHR